MSYNERREKVYLKNVKISTKRAKGSILHRYYDVFKPLVLNKYANFASKFKDVESQNLNNTLIERLSAQADCETFELV